MRMHGMEYLKVTLFICLYTGCYYYRQFKTYNLVRNINLPERYFWLFVKCVKYRRR
jgi:hypothetical protein